MIFTPRFFLILALSILLSIASIWQPESVVMSLALTVLLFAATLLDLLLTPRQPLTITRDCAAAFIQGVNTTVKLRIRNRTHHRLRCWVRDGTPSDFLSPEESIHAFLAPHSDIVVDYTVRSEERGTYSFSAIDYRVSGPLGLIQRQESIPNSAQVNVFPDISLAGARDLALSLGSPYLMGRRPLLMRGEGREFESLRDYQHDDDYRSIDWKATAKKGRLISRQFQAERDQRLLILIDLGRLMNPRIGAYRKLDYAINAAVRLAQTALAKGDLVGLLLFSDEIEFYLPPHKGNTQFAAIVQALVSARPRPTEPDYRTVFHYAARRNTRRTLMVCFTDLLDLDISQTLVESMVPLQPRHLPMAVTISDSDLLKILHATPEEGIDVYRHVAAQEVLHDYQRTIRALQSRGVLTVNVPANELTPATLNRYLGIKQSARL